MDRWLQLEREGTRLGCLDFGGVGASLLLLHGLAGHAGEWRALAGQLTARHRVVALDQRGHGRSERRPQALSRDAYVNDAAHAIECLRLAPAIVVGQSMGGSTAFLLAAERPDLVRRLVVIEASPDGPLPDLGTEIAAALGSWPVPFDSLDSAERFFASRGLEPKAWGEGLEHREDGLWPAFEVPVMVACVEWMAARDHWAEWRSLTCPTLVIVGEDGAGALAHARTMAEAIPGGEAAAIAGAGHEVHLEAPQALSDRLRQFLD